MEHTERYYEPVTQMLHNAGVFVSTVNPKLIKDYGNNFPRKDKTNKADSRKNAQYGLYSKTKVSMKNNLIYLLDQTYFGVEVLFSSPVCEDNSQKWVDFAASFWHLDCVRNVSLAVFT